ncbi:hemin uptake protein HemP [Xanthobacter sediminis]|uniref:hemin uptake protein HemP n=1 Tax=Xanthobacter sediminis TaxID=3119926 RepID=UPI00372BFD8D
MGRSGGGARAIPMVDAQLDSRDLFAVGRLITIAHGDQTYQLRLTAQNKLILTK